MWCIIYKKEEVILFILAVYTKEEVCMNNKKKYTGLIVSAIGLIFGIISSAVVNGIISNWENNLNNFNASQQSYFANYYYKGPEESEIMHNLSLYGGIKTFLIVLSVIVIIIGIIIFLKQNQYIKTGTNTQNSSSETPESESKTNLKTNTIEDVIKNAANISKQTVGKIKKYGKASIDVVKEKAAENEQVKTKSCDKCGSAISEGQNFCPSCGSKIITK